MTGGYNIQQTNCESLVYASQSMYPSITISNYDWISSGNENNTTVKKKLTAKQKIVIQRSAFIGFYSKPYYVNVATKKNEKEPVQRINKFKSLNENLII